MFGLLLANLFQIYLLQLIVYNFCFTHSVNELYKINIKIEKIILNDLQVCKLKIFDWSKPIKYLQTNSKPKKYTKAF